MFETKSVLNQECDFFPLENVVCWRSFEVAIQASRHASAMRTLLVREAGLVFFDLAFE
jgi:hypothetical protein